MGERIDSNAVNYGRNPDLDDLKDDRYVRCSKCGFICHLDRDKRGVRGSKEGNGIKQVT